MPVIDVNTLSDLVQAALIKAGVPEVNAALQANLLLEAELRGVPSHGLLRLSRIVSRIRNGVTDPHAAGHHEWTSIAFLTVDGQKGLGPIVAISAIEALLDRATASP